MISGHKSSLPHLLPTSLLEKAKAQAPNPPLQRKRRAVPHGGHGTDLPRRISLMVLKEGEEGSHSVNSAAEKRVRRARIIEGTIIIMLITVTTMNTKHTALHTAAHPSHTPNKARLRI